MGRKIWKIREDYRPLIVETKRLFPTLLGHVKTKRIALAGCYGRRNSFIGKIFGNQEPWCLLAKDYDYIIGFWSSRFDGKDHFYKIYVALHEMIHIPGEGHIPGARTYRKCVKHDLEDFTMLREHYGINLSNMKDVLKGEAHLLKGKILRFPRGGKEGIH